MSSAKPAPPQASLRSLVRPAILAHELLHQQKEQAADLVNEAQQLLELTEDLLQKIGLTQAQGVELNGVTPTNEPDTRAERMATAYASAGMAWAEILGAVTSFATELIRKGEFLRASHLAAWLEQIDEVSLATEIRSEVAEEEEEEEEEEATAADAFRSALDIIDRFKYEKGSITDVRTALRHLQSPIFHAGSSGRKLGPGIKPVMIALVEWSGCILYGKDIWDRYVSLSLRFSADQASGDMDYGASYLDEYMKLESNRQLRQLWLLRSELMSHSELESALAATLHGVLSRLLGE